jgi:hypothetical protein
MCAGTETLSCGRARRHADPSGRLGARELTLQNALTGMGFGLPGYFRIACRVDEAVIERSLEGFRRAIARFPTGT